MADPQPVPINAKFDDDFVTQLVVVLDTDTMQDVAAKVAHHVVGKRLPARDTETTMKAAKAARERVLSKAGVLAAMG